jgi:hypothetical protein
MIIKFKRNVPRSVHITNNIILHNRSQRHYCSIARNASHRVINIKISIYSIIIYYYNIATVFANYHVPSRWISVVHIHRVEYQIQLYVYYHIICILLRCFVYYCAYMCEQTEHAELLSHSPLFYRTRDEFSCQHFLLARIKCRPNDSHSRTDDQAVQSCYRKNVSSVSCSIARLYYKLYCDIK